ncbi:MAG: hypothetical protein EGR45_06220 [Ruminococcaceae bacterium]|nr:hypothetical protein [Oscillospiraceae bacterium]
MKKILAVILAALTIMVSGCSGALSEQEYCDRFFDSYCSFLTDVRVISSEFSKIQDGDSVDCDWDKVKTSAMSARSSLEAIEKLTPPEKYSAQHSEMIEKISGNKNWCDIAAQVADDRSATEEKLDELRDSVFEKSFNSAAVALIIQMKEDGLELK